MTKGKAALRPYFEPKEKKNCHKRKNKLKAAKRNKSKIDLWTLFKLIIYHLAKVKRLAA